jgi:murein L,D-transpeptidase YcbB/YkuD
MAMVGFLTGCATTSKQPSTVSQLQNRVDEIESQLDAQGEDIADIKSSISGIARHVVEAPDVTEASDAPRVRVEESLSKATLSGGEGVLRVPVDPREVQRALKSAGYYTGEIDGKLGAGSQKAIKDFQVEHQLVSDGIIGQKTWTQLKVYLE